jgi:transposase
MVCAQAQVPGVSVAQVARRYDLNANQVFNWLRDGRYAPDESAVDEAKFLPVEIVAEAGAASPSPVAAEGLIELELAGGHRLRISGRHDPDALARLIRGLLA